MVKVNKLNIEKLILFIIILFSPLFFYNLGGSSLVDFDEAWWAEIARNILIKKDPLVLYFNGQPSLFHPPFGYVLIALSQLFFGINEFSSRLSSAILGLCAVYLTYLIGKELFSRLVGLSASLMLTSSVWFIFRSRSANLDSIFVFMYLLTIYFFIKSKTNKKFIYLSIISLTLLFLTKAFIGLSVIIPLVTYYILNHKKINITLKEVKISIIIAALLLLPWLIANYLYFKDFSFLQRLYANAVKSSGRITPNILEIYKSNTIMYLHFGIREWFYPSIIAFFSSLLFIKKFSNLLVLYAWIIPLLIAFTVNQKTEIWHLIPLYPALGLLIGFFLYAVFEYAIKIMNSYKLHKTTKTYLSYIGNFCIFVALLVLCLKQIYEFKDEVGLFDNTRSGLSVVSQAARGTSETLFLDDENFLPSTVFYSQKEVEPLRSLKPPINTLKGYIASGSRPALLLTEKWRLDTDNINPSEYTVLSSSQGHLLIKLP